MPVDVLRCRVCESEYPAIANGICARCFGPLEPVYDWDELAQHRDARADRGRPALALALRGAAAGRSRPRTPRAAPASRRSSRRRGSRSALGVGEVFLKLDLANPTHSFKDRVVAVAAAKAQRVRARDAVGHVDRQPRERGRRARGRARACTRSSSARPGSSPRSSRRRRSTARTVYARPRQLRRLLAARQRVRRRGRVGDRQRQPALLLRRGLEDARVRDRRAARLGDAGRGRDADRLGRDVHEDLAGLRSSSSGSASISGEQPRLFGGQAEGCSPVATAFAEDRRVTPVRPEHGRLVDRDRQPGRRRPHDRERRAPSGGGIYSVPEDEVGPNISLLAETAGIFGEGATGVAIGALREAVAPRRARRARPRRRARHRHRPEDAAARRGERRDRRDRRRRRRAARRARSDCVTTRRLSRRDHGGRPRAARRDQQAARARARAARAQARRGDPAARSRARGAARRRAAGGQPGPAIVRGCRGVFSSCA